MVGGTYDPTANFMFVCQYSSSPTVISHCVSKYVCMYMFLPSDYAKCTLTVCQHNRSKS